PAHDLPPSRGGDLIPSKIGIRDASDRPKTRCLCGTIGRFPTNVHRSHDVSIFDKALVRAVIRELDSEQDRLEAAPIALLALILLVQDEVPEDVAPPLAYLTL